MTATATKKGSGGVEFACLGGSVTLRHGYKVIDKETGEKLKMYFTHKDIEKLKLPKERLALRNDGSEIGLIELDMQTRRKIIVPYKEELMIELLKNNEMVSEMLSGQQLTNKVGWYDPEKDKLDRQTKTKSKQMALLIVAFMKPDEIQDISMCLGIGEIDKVEVPELADILENKPDRVMALIEATMKDGVPKGKLLPSTRLEATLRRAIIRKVVVERSGALYFGEEKIGVDFKTTMKNLQNNTKGDDDSFAHIVPLIKEKLNNDK